MDRDVIERCAAILQVLTSTNVINIEKFKAYSRETATRLITLYHWYYLPASIHKVLMHGAAIINYFGIPIGQLSEEALEFRNKDIRRARSDHARKTSRTDTNTDLIHRLLESSDPLISSKRKILQKPNKRFHPDARYLMDLDSVDEDADNEDSESGSD